MRCASARRVTSASSLGLGSRIEGEIDARVDVAKSASAILAAVTGGATLLQSTDRLSYLEDALTEALDALRRPRR